MPFISKDWRSPGEAWVKTEDGWERLKVLECGKRKRYKIILHLILKQTSENKQVKTGTVKTFTMYLCICISIYIYIYIHQQIQIQLESECTRNTMLQRCLLSRYGISVISQTQFLCSLSATAVAAVVLRKCMCVLRAHQSCTLP